MAVDHAVVNGARLVVAGIAGSDDAVGEVGKVATGDIGERCGGGHEMLPGVGGQRVQTARGDRTPLRACCHGAV